MRTLFLDYETAWADAPESALRPWSVGFRKVGAALAWDDEEPRFVRDSAEVADALRSAGRIVVFNLAFESAVSRARYGVPIASKTDDVLMMARTLGLYRREGGRRRTGLKVLAPMVLGVEPWADGIRGYCDDTAALLRFMAVKKRRRECLRVLSGVGTVGAIRSALMDFAGNGARALDGGAKGLPEMVQRLDRLSAQGGPIAETLRRNLEAGRTEIGYDQVPAEIVDRYACLDVAHTRSLFRVLRERIVEAGLVDCYRRLYLPQMKLADVLLENGIAWDEDEAGRFEAAAGRSLRKMEEVMAGADGRREAAFGSPVKVAALLNRTVLSERMRTVRVVAEVLRTKNGAFPAVRHDFEGAPTYCVGLLEKWSLPVLRRTARSDAERKLVSDRAADLRSWADPFQREVYEDFRAVLGVGADDPGVMEDWPELRALTATRIAQKVRKALSAITGERAKVGRGSVGHLTPGSDWANGTPFRERGTADGCPMLLETAWQPCAVETKRWSSPIHTWPSGSDVRDIWVSRWPKGLLVHADFAAHEVRVVAGMSGDAGLRGIFEAGLDPHREVYSRIAGVPPESITGAQRAAAKAINFGAAYGVSPSELARRLGVSFGEASDLLLRFRREFARLDEWMIEMRRSVLDPPATVKTLFGDDLEVDMPEAAFALSNRQKDRLAAREWIGDEIGRGLHMGVNAALRQAVNYPVQSSASSVAAAGAWTLHREAEKAGLRARLIAFTHDSVDADVAIEDVPAFLRLLPGMTEEASRLCGDFPLALDVEVGVRGNRMAEIAGDRLVGEVAALREVEAVVGEDLSVEVSGERSIPLSDLFLLKSPWSNRIGVSFPTGSANLPGAWRADG